jgi:hypothetical protein
MSEHSDNSEDFFESTSNCPFSIAAANAGDQAADAVRILADRLSLSDNQDAGIEDNYNEAEDEEDMPLQLHTCFTSYCHSEPKFTEYVAHRVLGPDFMVAIPKERLDSLP